MIQNSNETKLKQTCWTSLYKSTKQTLTQTNKSKLKIKYKTVHLFVCHGGRVGVTTGSSSGSGIGFEIDDLNHTNLYNGVLICVSEKGTYYFNSDETSSNVVVEATTDAGSGITTRLSNGKSSWRS